MKIVLFFILCLSILCIYIYSIYKDYKNRFMNHLQINYEDFPKEKIDMFNNFNLFIFACIILFNLSRAFLFNKEISKALLLN